jgi:hypothetical protein
MNAKELTEIFKKPGNIEKLLIYKCRPFEDDGYSDLIEKIYRKAHLGSLVFAYEIEDSILDHNEDPIYIIGGRSMIQRWKHGYRDRACKVAAQIIISSAEYGLLFSLGLLDERNIIKV